MGTYVVISGGWGGGWEMTPLAEALRMRGHQVHTPTLSGLGDRAHVPVDPGCPERIRMVVNVDGGIAVEGQAPFPEWAETAQDGWIETPSEPDLANDLPEPAFRAWVVPLLRPHPVGTLLEPYPDTGGKRHGIPHAYVLCSDYPDEEEAFVTELRSDPAWRFVEVPLNHVAVLHSPDVIAEAITDLG